MSSLEVIENLRLVEHRIERVRRSITRDMQLASNIREDLALKNISKYNSFEELDVKVNVLTELRQLSMHNGL